MNVNMNVFSWIRDGVRRSVLLGFSDALSDIGASPEDELSDTMKGLVQEAPGGKTAIGSKGKTTASRKRLGRSLKELEQAKS